MLGFVFKGDYDVVINDYEKAKSLFGKTEVQVFKKCKIQVLLFNGLFCWGFFNLKAKITIGNISGKYSEWGIYYKMWNHSQFYLFIYLCLVLLDVKKNYSN